MRKLKLQMQISADGFVAGPNGEMEWMEWNWGEDVGNYITRIMQDADTIVMGRKMAPGFIGHWESQLATNESDDSAQWMVSTPKIIFSKTISQLEGQNVMVSNDDLSATITALKQEPGGDIIAYGGAGFVSSLIKEGLIDEFHLLVNPAAIGKGLSIFGGLESTQKLKLQSAMPFDCGIVALFYTKN